MITDKKFPLIARLRDIAFGGHDIGALCNEAADQLAHLQSQLDECRKERDAVNEEHGLAVTALSLANEDLEERGKIIDGLRADLELEQSAVARFDRVNLEAKLNAAETALAASQAQVGMLQMENHGLNEAHRKLAMDNADSVLALSALRAQVGELQKDKQRLDAIPHGWRIGHEAGASGHPDHWYIWTSDWSQPLGEGETLRAAIDAATSARAAETGEKA
jgi:hypothetical protein